MRTHQIVVGIVSFVCFSISVTAQDKTETYFVTYDHNMEELDALEVSMNATAGRDKAIPSFVGFWTEFEYGARPWWTAEFYLDWEHTQGQGSGFTGARFENRFRLIAEEHAINPVLYVEYEHLNDADRILKEVVGFDGKQDFAGDVSEEKHEPSHELEGKLILSSNPGDWNVAGNFTVEKNLHDGPFEFGYSIGSSHSVWGRHVLGAVELYGGLGTTDRLTTGGTSHYIAPVVTFVFGDEVTLRVSPTWGLTDTSINHLFRFGVSTEIDNVSRAVTRLFR